VVLVDGVPFLEDDLLGLGSGLRGDQLLQITDSVVRAEGSDEIVDNRGQGAHENMGKRKGKRGEAGTQPAVVAVQRVMVASASSERSDKKGYLHLTRTFFPRRSLQMTYTGKWSRSGQPFKHPKAHNSGVPTSIIFLLYTFSTAY
jgi:hypothetical protein